MTVYTMVPNDRQTLPALSQHCSISFRDNSSGQDHFNRRGETVNVIGAMAPRFSDGISYSISRTESSGQSSSRSDSSISESSNNRSGQSSSKLSTSAASITARTETSRTLHPQQSLNVLPRLLDDRSFVRSARTDKQHSAFSSRSLEILPSRDFISDELRLRTVSLPILGTRGKHSAMKAARMLNHADKQDEELTDCYPSDTDDQSGDDSQIVEIDPYPNIGVGSYLDSHLLPEFLPQYLKPWTPEVRKTKLKRNHKKVEEEKKKKEMEMLLAKQRKRNSHTKSNPRRHSVRTNAFARKRDQEVAKQYPVRKQFVYSELIQDEFQKHIPKRMPGGKLKPIYNRRTTEGDIYIPDDIHVSFEKLSVKPGDERINLLDTAAAINRRRKEELQALLEKRKKIQRQMANKKKRRVHFVLPGENHEGTSLVAVEGSVQNGNESFSEMVYNEDVEDTTEENNTSVEGEQGNPSLSDRIEGEVVEGEEYNITRTNSWVAEHIDQQLSTSVGKDSKENENAVNHNAAKDKEDIVHVDVTNIQANRDITVYKSSVLDNSTVISMSHPNNVNAGPHEIRESSGNTKTVLSISESVTQADDPPGKLSNVRSTSLLRAVEPSPVKESGSVTVKIEFLSERIPSIIVPDA